MENLTPVGARTVYETTDVDQHGETAALTRNEDIVFTALQSAGRPMKAYELLELLHDQGLKAPMTIYRALEGLQSKTFVHKVVSQNAFICVDHSEEPNFRAVVTCRQCGDARLVALAEYDVQAMLGAINMPISNVVFEVVGECANKPCSKN